MSNDPMTFVRLYTVEGTMSLTGTNSDYRLRLTPAAQLEFVLALIQRGWPETLRRRPRRFRQFATLQRSATAHGISGATVTRLVDDLLAARGKGIVYAGAAHGADVHAAVNVLNDILGNTASVRCSCAGGRWQSHRRMNLPRSSQI